MSQPAPEKRPALMRETAHWKVMQDLAERAHFGQEKYGTPLLGFNGRDQIHDAYEEELDKLVYLRLALEEWDHMVRLLDDEEAMAERLKALGWVCYSPRGASANDMVENYIQLLQQKGYNVIRPPVVE